MGIWKGPSLFCCGKDDEVFAVNDDCGNGEDGVGKDEERENNKLLTAMPKTNAIITMTARGLDFFFLLIAAMFMVKRGG